MAIPRTLEERLRSGKIVPFVGAGVSLAVRNKETDAPSCPSWKQLRERVAQRLEEEQKKVESQLGAQSARNGVRCSMSPKSS